MIDWGNLVGHTLWISGLAVGLAALSIANHRALEEACGLRQKLVAPGFQAAVQAAAVLICAGIFFSASVWWIRGIAAAVATALAGWALTPRLLRQRGSALAGGSRPRPATAMPLSRSGALGWGLVAAGALIVGGWSIVTAVQTLGHARSLQMHLEQLQMLTEAGPMSLEAADLERVGQHLAGMRQDLEAIDVRIGPLLPLGRLLAWVPTYGGDLAASADLLEAAVKVAASGDRTFQALSPALVLLDGSPADSAADAQLGEQLLPILIAARPTLQEARQDLATVQQSRGRIDPNRLSPRVASLLERLDRYLPWIDTAVDGALLAPGLLGAGGPQIYLAVAQNNHELRATGGFVSGVGEIKVEDGRIISQGFRDSYAVDDFEVPHEAAPPDLQAALSGEMWVFRDANWHPDLSTSARQMLEIYARDQGVAADGLITVDLTALELMLEALGPLNIEGIAEPVTKENVQRIVQEQWANPSAGPGIGENWSREWWQHRKDFMGEVATALLGRLQAGDDIRLGVLVRVLNQALEEKHILIHLEDAEAAALLRRRNWDGSLPGAPLESDFLAVIDSNVGFNKVDPNIERLIRYEVDLTRREGPRARLNLTYHNRSSRQVDACIQEARYGETYADMMDRCYWNYVRVYVPAGSRLLSGPDLAVPAGSLLARSGTEAAAFPPDQSLDGNLAEWRAFFDLAPGEERTLEFDYELPAGVLERPTGDLLSYILRVQKQPGTGRVPLELTLLLPEGAELLETLPPGLALQPAQDSPGGESILVLFTDLGVDRQIKIAFR